MTRRIISLRIRNLFAVLLLSAALPAGPVLRAQEKQAAPASSQAPAAKPQAAQPESRETEKRISPAAAQELFRSVDDILSFASKDTHLPTLHPVKRELASRQTVREFITRHMQEDQDAQRLQRSEVSLKKFGLLPRDFKLRNFLLDVLEDQVAGYYDPKTQTVYLLDWVNPEAQLPVLAHELTHALQDQNVGLEKWLEVRPEPKSKKPAEDDMDSGPEEEQSARLAVSEGQAMVVLVDYILDPGGRSLADTPMMAEMFKKSTIDRANEAPLLAAAPLYLRESLIFSYTYGLGFEQELLAKGGKELAFAGALRNPPRDTRQIIEPKTYLAGEHVGPMAFPRLSRIVRKNYQGVDSGTVGQFDVYVLFKQFSGAALAEKLSPQWRGGVYYVGRSKEAARKAAKDAGKARVSGQEEAPIPTSEAALFYLSRWATAEDAARFAEVYRSFLPHRYKSVKAVPGDGLAAGSGATGGGKEWMTEEGPVYVEPRGNTVLVMEGFDEATAARIRDAVARQSKSARAPQKMLGIGAPVFALLGRYH